MTDDINAKIALKLGYKPPGSPEHDARLASGPCPIGGRRDDWLHPNGKSMEGLPRFDADWAATGELVETCEEIHIHSTKCSPGCSGDYWTVSLGRNGCSGSAQRHSLQKAIAEAWWHAATEAERE